jgi:hypothetical protein
VVIGDHVATFIQIADGFFQLIDGQIVGIVVNVLFAVRLLFCSNASIFALLKLIIAP